MRAVAFVKPGRDEPYSPDDYRVLAVGNLLARMWTRAHSVCIAVRVGPLLAAEGQFGVGIADGCLRAHACAQAGYDAGLVAVKADFRKGYDRMHGGSAVAAVSMAAPEAAIAATITFGKAVVFAGGTVLQADALVGQGNPLAPAG